jgi:hypothetical protein
MDSYSLETDEVLHLRKLFLARGGYLNIWKRPEGFFVFAYSAERAFSQVIKASLPEALKEAKKILKQIKGK